MHRARLALLLALGQGLAGCAGVHELQPDAAPAPAVITIASDGESRSASNTPATVTLDADDALHRYRVTVRKAGFAPQSFDLTWAAGWKLGDRTVASRYGVVCVDPETGMAWKLGDPEPVADADARFVIMIADSVPLGMWKTAERLR